MNRLKRTRLDSRRLIIRFKMEWFSSRGGFQPPRDEKGSFERAANGIRNTAFEGCRRERIPVTFVAVLGSGVQNSKIGRTRDFRSLYRFRGQFLKSEHPTP